jgi:hypothetical protein
MADLRDLYQEVILEHSKAPRNYRELKTADRKAEGFNPLCGDRLTVYVEMQGRSDSRHRFSGIGLRHFESLCLDDDAEPKRKNKGASESAVRRLSTNSDRPDNREWKPS